MNRPTSILVLAMVVCVAASYGLWLELRAEHKRADVLQSRVLELERLLTVAVPADGPAASSNPSPESTEVAVPMREPKTVLGADAADARHQHSAHVDFREDEARMLRDPKYRQARRAFGRVQLASTYIDLAASLEISQDQADKLIDLLAEQELRHWDVAVPDLASEEELRTHQLQLEEIQRANDAEREALLGKQKFEQWKEYEASLGTRHQVQQLRVSLSAGSEPLRDDQVQPLIDVIYAEQKQVEEALGEYTGSLISSGDQQVWSQSLVNERRAQLAAAANERIQTAAASFLSQQQLEGLDELLQRQLDMEKAQHDMMRASEGMLSAHPDRAHQ